MVHRVRAVRNPQVVVTVFVYGGGEGSEVAAPMAADILRAYFRLSPDAPLASAQPSGAPPVVIVAPRPASGPAPSRRYGGQVVGVDTWAREAPNVFGTVLDANGRGVAGVRVVADKCSGNAVHSTTTDANGAFSVEILYYKDSPRWCIHTVSPDSDPVPMDVAPYKRFTFQFVPTQ
jgi:hypothetical protein